MWWERTLGAIRSADRPVLIVGDEKWGVRLLLEAPFLLEHKCLVLDLGRLDARNPVAAGNLISDSVFSTFGDVLCSYGRPYPYVFESLKQHMSRSDLFAIVILCSDEYPEFASQLLLEFGTATPTVLWSRDGTVQAELKLECNVISAEDFALAWDEGRALIPHVYADEQVDSALRISNGAICDFLNHFLVLGKRNTQLSFASAPRDTLMGRTDLNIDSENWHQVWYSYRALSPDSIPGIIDRIGDCAFASGYPEQFWNELHDLPMEIQDDPKVLYWLFATSINLGKYGELMARVDCCLDENVAPNLRALKAASMLGDDALEQAELAYRSDATPVTMRAYGFLLASNARPYEGREVLRKAIKISDEHARTIQVVYSSSAMANCELQLGNYSNYVAWSQWATQLMDMHGFRDQVYRWRLLSEQAYGLLLLGRMEEALQIASRISEDQAEFGMPGLDGMYGTLGMLKVLSGDPEVGLLYLHRNAHALPTELACLAYLEYVTALEIMKRREELAEVAVSCSARLTAASKFSHSVAHLIDAIHSFQDNPGRTIDQALQSLLKFTTEVEAPFVAQAAIWLAKGWIKVGNLNHARKVLNEYQYALRELSGLGWVALGGDDKYLHEVVELFERAPEAKTIRVLGKRTILEGIEEKELPLRFAELMVLLQNAPQGLTGEQLTLQLYGSDGNVSTLKATLSKLRREIEVASKPYRLDAPLVSDYRDVVQALETGDVEKAVELYSGSLLPDSEAPGIVALRDHLEESMRQAVLSSGDGALLVHVARLLDEDLELWEAAEAALPPHSSLLPLARAQVQRIRRDWGVEVGRPEA